MQRNGNSLAMPQGPELCSSDSELVDADEELDEETSVEALLALFQREDAEIAGCKDGEGDDGAVVATLRECEAIEAAVANARVLQALRVLRGQQAEAQACGALHARRHRLLRELQKLRTEELRTEVAGLRERLDEQTRLTLSLQAELAAISQNSLVEDTSHVAMKLDAESQDCMAVSAEAGEHATELRSSQAKELSSLALDTGGVLEETTGASAAALLAEIRTALLSAAGSAAADMLGRALQRLGAEQYGRRSRFLEELLQNADDCKFPPGFGVPMLQLHAFESAEGELESLTLLHNEEGLTERDVRSLCNVGHSTKAARHVAGQPRRTGHKGVGFKSTFLVTDKPVLFSRGGYFSFAFDRQSEHGPIGVVLPIDVAPEDARALAPEWVSATDLSAGTMLHLPLLPGLSHSDLRPALEPAPEVLLFLRRLRALRVVRGSSSTAQSLWQLQRSPDAPCGNGGALVQRTIELRRACGDSQGQHTCFTWLVYRHSFSDSEGSSRHIELAFPQPASNGGVGQKEFISTVGGSDVFCILPVQRAGLPFLLNAEDLELTTARSEVCADAPVNQLLRVEALRAALAALAAHEELREPLLYALRPRLRGAGGLADAGTAHGDNAAGATDSAAPHAGFFEPLLQGLVAQLRTMPCLRSEAGDWCCPGDLRIRPSLCSAELISNTTMWRSTRRQFAACEIGREEELLRIGVHRLTAEEVLLVTQEALRKGAAERPSSWFQSLYSFLAGQQQELAEAGLMPAMRGIPNLLRVQAVGGGEVELVSLSGAPTPPFLGIAHEACWPSHDLQIEDLAISSAVRCVCLADFAQPEAKRFLELQGLREASLEDIVGALTRMHWRGDFADTNQCWGTLRYLCRLWPQLRNMQALSTELRSALCCPCEDGSLRGCCDVHVWCFLGEACGDCVAPSREVCGTLPPHLEADWVARDLEVCNIICGRELHCRARSALNNATWLAVRGTCGVVAGCWRYDVHVEKLPSSCGSLAIGWGAVDVPMQSLEAATARTVLVGDSGWLSRAREISRDPHNGFAEGWDVACLLDATDCRVRFDFSSDGAAGETSSWFTTGWLPVPKSLRGAELWPLLRLRHGACARVSFAGPPGGLSGTEDDYRFLAQACSKSRAASSRRSSTWLARAPPTLEGEGDMRQPLALEWEAFFVGLGARPHWEGCTNRHRWRAALEKPLDGDCPVCLMPLAMKPGDTVSHDAAGGSSLDVQESAAALWLGGLDPCLRDHSTISAGVVGLPCEHKFHSACVQDLASHSAHPGSIGSSHGRRPLRCPVCRNPFQAEEQVKLVGTMSRRASRLCAPLRECLAADADASLHAMLREYALGNGADLLRLVCAPTSCGPRPLEECFLPGPALHALCARVGPQTLPYLSGVAADLHEVLAACGVTLKLDALGAVQVLRALCPLGTASQKLVNFLYRAISEEVLLNTFSPTDSVSSLALQNGEVEEASSPQEGTPLGGSSSAWQALRALAAEDLVLAQTPGKDGAPCSGLSFVNARQCVWDGPPEIAEALRLHGPLERLYGNDPLLQELFLNKLHFAQMSLSRCDLAACATALASMESRRDRKSVV